MAESNTGLKSGEDEDWKKTALMLRAIECPVCKLVPLYAIYSCFRGHFVCQDCRFKLTKCEVCMQPFYNSRNHVMERVIGKLVFCCRFKEEGCKIMLSGKLLKKHIKRCTFSFAKCNVCDKRIRIENYIEHLVSDHGVHGHSVEKKFEVFGNAFPTEGFCGVNAKYLPNYFLHDGNYFIYHATIKKGSFNSWITFVGTPEDAAKYEVTVVLFRHGYTAPEIGWKLQVNSCRRQKTRDLHVFSIYWLQLRPFLVDRCGDPRKQHRFVWKTKFIVNKLRQ